MCSCIRVTSEVGGCRPGRGPSRSRTCGYQSTNAGYCSAHAIRCDCRRQGLPRRGLGPPGRPRGHGVLGPRDEGRSSPRKAPPTATASAPYAGSRRRDRLPRSWRRSPGSSRERRSATRRSAECRSRAIAARSCSDPRGRHQRRVVDLDRPAGAVRRAGRDQVGRDRAVATSRPPGLEEVGPPASTRRHASPRPSPASRARTIAWARSATWSLAKIDGDVVGDGLRRRAQPVGDRGVGQPGREQVEDLALARRSARGRRLGRRRRGAVRKPSTRCATPGRRSPRRRRPTGSPARSRPARRPSPGSPARRPAWRRTPSRRRRTWSAPARRPRARPGAISRVAAMPSSSGMLQVEQRDVRVGRSRPRGPPPGRSSRRRRPRGPGARSAARPGRRGRRDGRRRARPGSGRSPWPAHAGDPGGSTTKTRPPLRARPGLERAAELGGALAHAGEADAGDQGLPDPPSSVTSTTRRVGAADRDDRAAGAGVPGDVGQRLGRDPVGGDLDRGRQRRAARRAPRAGR